MKYFYINGDHRNMKQREIIKDLFTNGSSIEYFTQLLEEMLRDKGIVKPYDAIMAEINKHPSQLDFEFFLDETLGAFQADVELESFYAGIDFALTLLGHEPVFNLLPADKTKKDIQA